MDQTLGCLERLLRVLLRENLAKLGLMVINEGSNVSESVN